MTERQAVEHWKGDFGNAYTLRNESTEQSLASRGRRWPTAGSNRARATSRA